MNWDWDKLQEKRKHQPNAGKANAGKANAGKANAGKANAGKANAGKGRNPNDNNKTDDTQNNGHQDKNNEEDTYFNFNKDGGNNNYKSNKIPFGNGQDPRKMVENLKLPGLKWILILGILIWLATGIFIVRPDEAGVILRFGAYNRTVEAGMHYHLPFPIESVALPKVTQIRQIHVGQRASSPLPSQNSMNSRGSSHVSLDDEASMLTGDENIVDIQFIIQYYIKPDGVVDYLYKVVQPDEVVKKAAEAAMREVVGKGTLDNILTVGRNDIQMQVEELLQNILDKYEVGIQVAAVQMQDVQPPVAVRDAFKDVASAREDKERLTNEARAYSSDILPKAKGQAAEKLNQAEAYKQARVRNAEGETSRFLAILKEYEKAEDVTKQRLLYESLEQILGNPALDKVILPEGAGNQVLPFLPLSPSGAISPELMNSLNSSNPNITQNTTQNLQNAQNSMNTNTTYTQNTQSARGGR